MLQRNRNRTKPASPHWLSEMGGLGGCGGSSGGLGCQFAGNGLLGWVLIGASSKNGVERCGDSQKCIGNEWQAVTHGEIRQCGFHPRKQFAGRPATWRAVVHTKIQKCEMDDIKEFCNRTGCRSFGRVAGLPDQF